MKMRKKKCKTRRFKLPNSFFSCHAKRFTCVPNSKRSLNYYFLEHPDFNIDRTDALPAIILGYDTRLDCSVNDKSPFGLF